MRNYAKERELPRSGLVQHIVGGNLPYNPFICVLGVQTARIIFRILRIAAKSLGKNRAACLLFLWGGGIQKSNLPITSLFRP
jgi:hypothetical protein